MEVSEKQEPAVKAWMEGRGQQQQQQQQEEEPVESARVEVSEQVAEQLVPNEGVSLSENDSSLPVRKKTGLVAKLIEEHNRKVLEVTKPVTRRKLNLTFGNQDETISEIESLQDLKQKGEKKSLKEQSGKKVGLFDCFVTHILTFLLGDKRCQRRYSDCCSD